MPGCIIGDTEIAVDFWNIRRAPWLKLFFLTHMHSDHIEGLTSTWQHPVYCSQLTATLLHVQLQLPNHLLRPLTIGDRHWIPLDDGQGESMTVTVLGAHHCPGAVMYQFEGHFGSILVTGDFRFCDEMQHDLDSFVKAVDVLYLDNTYCDPCCTFGPRIEYADEIVSLIRRHPEHRVLLGIHNLGKEELLVHIAQATQSWIVVPPDRLSVLSKLNLPNVFTADVNASRIRVVPLSSANAGSISRWTAECSTIIIMCTALYTGLDGKPYCNHDNVYIVPYSDHSSYSELRSFVGSVLPRSIVPLVSYAKHGPLGTQLRHRADMSCFNDLLDSSQLLPVAAAPPAPAVANARRRRRRQAATAAAAAAAVAVHGVDATVTLDNENRQRSLPQAPTPRQGSAQRSCAARLLSAARRQQLLRHQQRPPQRVLGVRFDEDFSPVGLAAAPGPELASTPLERKLPSSAASLPPASLRANGAVHDSAAGGGGRRAASLAIGARCEASASAHGDHHCSTGHLSPVASDCHGDGDSDKDDFIAFYVPSCLRVRREDAFSSVLRKLGNAANGSTASQQ